MFEYMDEEAYEKLQEQRCNDDFIVDDEGYGYRDKGGEIWEYDDVHYNENQKGAGKKSRKINQVSNQHQFYLILLFLALQKGN